MVRSTAFVGRRPELSLLDEAMRRAQAGEPQFVIVGGDSPVGMYGCRRRPQVQGQPAR